MHERVLVPGRQGSAAPLRALDGIGAAGGSAKRVGAVPIWPSAILEKTADSFDRSQQEAANVSEIGNFTQRVCLFVRRGDWWFAFHEYSRGLKSAAMFARKRLAKIRQIP